MSRPASKHPTDGELEILRVLWSTGPLPLGELCEQLRTQREVATTTVATMLRVMSQKGLVARKGSGRGAVWQAKVTRERAAKSLVGKLLEGVFEGSAPQLVAHLVESNSLSASDLTELESLLAMARRRGAQP